MKNLKEKSIEDFKTNAYAVEIQDDQLKAIQGGSIIIADLDMI